MSIQVFNYNNKQIRTIEKNGEIWFVAKDVCDVLELSDVNMSVSRLDDDEKLVQKLFVSGQNRDVITISEPGLYGLILRSNKPEAKSFSRWVKHEVLPTIRKTGSYGEKSLSVANEIIPMTERILSAAGIKGNQLALALDRTAKHYTGVSLLELSGFQLEAPVKEQALNPTQIGELIGGLNAKQVNEILAGMGFQHKIAGKWEPLEPGMPYAVMLDVGKKHSNGIPVRYLNWNSSVVKEVKKYVERTGTED